MQLEQQTDKILDSHHNAPAIGVNVLDYRKFMKIIA